MCFTYEANSGQRVGGCWISQSGQGAQSDNNFQLNQNRQSGQSTQSELIAKVFKEMYKVVELLTETYICAQLDESTQSNQIGQSCQIATVLKTVFLDLNFAKSLSTKST